MKGYRNTKDVILYFRVQLKDIFTCDVSSASVSGPNITPVGGCMIGTAHYFGISVRHGVSTTPVRIQDQNSHKDPFRSN